MLVVTPRSRTTASRPPTLAPISRRERCPHRRPGRVLASLAARCTTPSTTPRPQTRGGRRGARHRGLAAVGPRRCGAHRRIPTRAPAGPRTGARYSRPRPPLGHDRAYDWQRSVPLLRVWRRWASEGWLRTRVYGRRGARGALPSEVPRVRRGRLAVRLGGCRRGTLLGRPGEPTRDDRQCQPQRPLPVWVEEEVQEVPRAVTPRRTRHGTEREGPCRGREG